MSEIQQKYDAPAEDVDEWLGPSYDDTDGTVLHRFCEEYADKIGKELLSASKPSGDLSGEGSVGPGKQTWDFLCAKLIELGQPAELPVSSTLTSSEHDGYLTMMSKFSNRDTSTVQHIFKEITVSSLSS